MSLSDKFGVPYGGLTNGIQQALGLPTMADVGCNPICDATDPDEQRIHDLAVGITADSQHSFGCIAQAYGLGGSGAVAYKLGQPIPGTKPFITPGTSEGTSWISQTLSELLPIKGSFQAPVGGPFTGTALRWSRTGNLGRAIGRWAPFAGIVSTAYSAVKLWNCL